MRPSTITLTYHSKGISMKLIKYTLLLITSFLTSCSLSKINDKPTIQPYPLPNVSNQSQFAYPLPSVDYSSQFPTLTINPDYGIVRLIIYNNGKPLSFYNFYLASVLKDPKTGLELSASLDRSKAPHALSNEKGEVFFVNVPPGRYGLMFIEATDSYLLLNPSDGSPMFITVEAGSNIDLGLLEYSDLPVD